ncbi:hypothetical protein [Mucilaginibacter sp.]
MSYQFAVLSLQLDCLLTHHSLLITYNPLHAPDPGNAGVGRGNKLSVLHIQPWCADGLTFFI